MVFMFAWAFALAVLLSNPGYIISALSVPNVPTYEKLAYLDQQRAASPVGRPDYQGLGTVVVGAALLAATAVVVYRIMQQPSEQQGSCWPSFTAILPRFSRLQAQLSSPATAPACLAPTSCVGITPAPASPTPGSPSPVSMAPSAPPSTPASGLPPAPMLSTPAIASQLRTSAQHHLAVGTTAAGTSPPVTPRSAAGPEAGSALFDSLVNSDSCSTKTQASRLLMARYNNPVTLFQPIRPAALDVPIAASDISPANMSPNSTANAHTNTAPMPNPSHISVAVMPSAGASVSYGFVSPNPSCQAVGPAACALAAFAGAPPPPDRVHSRSLPGSPGAWGSAVKVSEHNGFQGARASGMDGLMARIDMLRMAEAAAAEAASETNSILSTPIDVASSCGTSAGASPIMSGRASPATVPAAGTLMRQLPERQHILPCGLLLHFMAAAAGTGPGRDSDITCGSPMAAAHTGCTSTVLMSAAADNSVPSPRGLASLMAAGAGLDAAMMPDPETHDSQLT